MTDDVVSITGKMLAEALAAKSGLAEQNANLSLDVEDLQDELTEASGFIIALERTIDDLNDRIENLDDELKSANDHISLLEEQIDDMSTELEEALEYKFMYEDLCD